MRAFVFFALVFWATAASVATAEEPLVRITFRPDKVDGSVGDEQTTAGKIVKETPEGIVLLVDRGGRLWPILPQRISKREETGETFKPFTPEEMAAELKKELGDGFETHVTRHYVLCSEASREYAKWAGLLFERLMAAFNTQLDRRPLDLREPEFPLCAIILKDERRYREFALEDAGPEVLEALGYYSNLSNRMVMYDLTAGLSGRPPQDVLELSRKLAGQIANVSTIVHEATHQIAFNSGLHVRLADNPFWLVEGMAMYFETPDLKNVSGWKTVGALNQMRLRDYKEYVQTRRKPGSLEAMLTADEKFQTANTALDSYAEAWALTHFLIERKRAAYVDYLDKLSEKQTLEQDEPAVRVAEFEAAFGKIEDVEKELAKFINSPRLK